MLICGAVLQLSPPHSLWATMTITFYFVCFLLGIRSLYTPFSPTFWSLTVTCLPFPILSSCFLGLITPVTLYTGQCPFSHPKLLWGTHTLCAMDTAVEVGPPPPQPIPSVSATLTHPTAENLCSSKQQSRSQPPFMTQLKPMAQAVGSFPAQADINYCSVTLSENP